MFKFLIMLLFSFGCAHVTTPVVKKDMCPATYVHAPKGYVLTTNDHIAQKSATTRCKYHFPESPCLKMFTVLGFQDYHATCGKP